MQKTMPAHQSARRALAQGVYVPLVTPFVEDSEDVDLVAWQAHVLRVAKSGCSLVVLGTNGEAVHLSDSERRDVVRAAKDVLVRNGLEHTNMIVGAGAPSVRSTLAIAGAAAEDGADAVIVLPPGFFAMSLLANDKEGLRSYYRQIADQSPVPVLLYNFPAVAGGIDMDSAFISELALHPNIVGVKLTCGSIGKGVRIITSPQLQDKEGFIVFPGYSEALAPAVTGGHKGIITGTANCFPLLIKQAWSAAVMAVGGEPLDQEEYKYLPKGFLEMNQVERIKEVRRLQAIVSAADYAVVKCGIAGTKWYTGRFYPNITWGGLPRQPLPTLSSDARKKLEGDLVDAYKAERALEKEIQPGLSALA